MYRSFLKLIFKYLSGSFFINFKLFKKKDIYNPDDSIFKIQDDKNFAIVIQGPLIEDSNFTIESIKMYRLYYPNTLIIFSTWKIEKCIYDILKDLNIHIIQNTKPIYNGISNVNLQIVTTISGISLAKKLDAKYVLKTRSDQRIYHPGLKDYLFSLLKTFPVTKKCLLQKERLIGVSLNTFKFRLYGLSDHFLFGHVDDVALYFNVNLDNRKISPEVLSSSFNTWKDFSKLGICEVYFCTNFLNKLGYQLSYTLTDSFNMFKDHFLIIDQFAISLYWHKYTLDFDRYKHLGFLEPELSFNDWILLGTGDLIPIKENILENKI